MPGGKLAGGKNPTKESFDFLLGPADVALAAERNPDIQAVGIFTGIRGKGIVILDVDRNLNKVIARWGDTLRGAPNTSTKKNAAKYIFRVPEALWNEVEGRGLNDDADYDPLER